MFCVWKSVLPFIKRKSRQVFGFRIKNCSQTSIMAFHDQAITELTTEYPDYQEYHKYDNTYISAKTFACSSVRENF